MLIRSSYNKNKKDVVNDKKKTKKKNKNDDEIKPDIVIDDKIDEDQSEFHDVIGDDGKPINKDDDGPGETDIVIEIKNNKKKK